MKFNNKFFYLIFPLMMGSCFFVSKKNHNTDVIDSVSYKHNSRYEDTIWYDSTYHELNARRNPASYEIIFDKTIVNDNDRINNNGQNIILSHGKIAYSFPDTMVCYKPERAILRITKTENDTVLVEVKNKKYNTFFIVEKIRVGSLMSAKIISTDSSFKIRELSSVNQNIEKQGYTHWEWEITPTKPGVKTLTLTVTVLKDENGDTVTKDLPILERDIHIISNNKKDISIFLNDNWKWLFSVILLPVFKYIYDHIRKKKEVIS